MVFEDIAFSENAIFILFYYVGNCIQVVKRERTEEEEKTTGGAGWAGEGAHS